MNPGPQVSQFHVNYSTIVAVLEVAACHVIKRGGGFPGRPVGKTLPSKAGALCSTPGWETNPCLTAKKKTKHHMKMITDSIKTLKIVPVKKKKNVHKKDGGRNKSRERAKERGSPTSRFEEFEHFLNSDSVSFLKLSFSHSSFFILSPCRRGVLKFMCGVSQCPQSQMFTYPLGLVAL